MSRRSYVTKAKLSRLLDRVNKEKGYPVQDEIWVQGEEYANDDRYLSYGSNPEDHRYVAKRSYTLYCAYGLKGVHQMSGNNTGCNTIFSLESDNRRLEELIYTLFD